MRTSDSNFESRVWARLLSCEDDREVKRACAASWLFFQNTSRSQLSWRLERRPAIFEFQRRPTRIDTIVEGQVNVWSTHRPIGLLDLPDDDDDDDVGDRRPRRSLEEEEATFFADATPCTVARARGVPRDGLPSTDDLNASATTLRLSEHRADETGVLPLDALERTKRDQGVLEIRYV